MPDSKRKTIIESIREYVRMYPDIDTGRSILIIWVTEWNIPLIRLGQIPFTRDMWTGAV